MAHQLSWWYLGNRFIYCKIRMYRNFLYHPYQNAARRCRGLGISEDPLDLHHLPVLSAPQATHYGECQCPGGPADSWIKSMQALKLWGRSCFTNAAFIWQKTHTTECTVDWSRISEIILTFCVNKNAHELKKCNPCQNKCCTSVPWHTTLSLSLSLVCVEIHLNKLDFQIQASLFSMFGSSLRLWRKDNSGCLPSCGRTG